MFTNVATASTIDRSDLNTKITSGEFESANALIKTEAVSNPSLLKNVTLSFNANNVLKDFNTKILGVHAGLFEMGTNFFDYGTNNLSEGYLALADKMYDIPTARIGTGNNTNLMNNIGPVENRTVSKNLDTGEVTHQPVDMGIVEMIKAIYAVNPNASFMVILPINVQTPTESAHLASFLLDDKNASEWGALRAECGIENPIKLEGFEIGNENYFTAEPEEGMDSSSASYATYQKNAIDKYINTGIAQVEAVHAVHPEVKFYANVNGKKERVSATPWNTAVAARLGSYIDGVAFHGYYSSAGSVKSVCEDAIDWIQGIFVEQTGKKTKIAHTEHAIWSSDEKVKRQSLESALSESAFISRISLRDDVISADCHHYTSVGTEQNPCIWAFFTRHQNKFYELGNNFVYKLYLNNIGEKILNSKYTDTEGVGYSLSHLVTKTSDGKIVLALTNHYEDRDIKVNFTSKYKVLKTITFTAPNMSSMVYNDATKDVFRTTTAYPNQSGVSSYTVPNKSLVFLTLEEEYKDMYYEDFEGYDTSAEDITLVKNEGVTSKDIAGDWKLRTYKSLDYVNNSKVAIVDGKALKITPSGRAYTAPDFPVVEYQGDYSKLGNNFAIEFDVHKNSVYEGTGVKFMIHNDGKNYYALWLNGGIEENYRWTFVRVVNNEVVYTKNGDSFSANATAGSGALHQKNHVTVKYDNDNISWDINGFSYAGIAYSAFDNYTDSSKFTVSPSNTTIAFGNSSGNLGVTATFDNIAIKYYKASSTELPVTPEEPEYPNIVKDTSSTDAFVTSGEPSNVIYADRKGSYNNGVYKFADAVAIRKIVNNNSSSVSVYVSNDDYSYKKLATVNPGGEFINQLTSKKYSYVKVDGGSNVCLYTDVNNNDVFTSIEDVSNLSAVIGGSSENVTITSSNRNVAYIENGILIPLRNGTTTLTASNGTSSISKTVRIKAFTVWDEDFSSYTKNVTVSTPLGTNVKKAQIAGDWWLVQDHGGVVSHNPTAKINYNGLTMTAGTVGPFYGGLAMAQYLGDYSGLTDKYRIDVKYNKASVMSTLGIKFGMHNNDGNYYMLMLSGKSGSGYMWSFYKVNNYNKIYEQNGELIEAYATDNKGSLHGSGTFSIIVDGNKISWQIDGKKFSDRPYTASGDFIDDKPFDIEARNTKIGLFVAGEYETREGSFKRITVTSNEDTSRIMKSPVNDDYYVDMSNTDATDPIVLLAKPEETLNQFMFVRNTELDGFVKLPKSLFEDSTIETKGIESKSQGGTITLNDTVYKLNLYSLNNNFEQKYHFTKIYLWDLSNLKPLNASYSVDE